MKTILQTALKPQMTRMNAEARGRTTTEPHANNRQVLDCGSPRPLSNRNAFVWRVAKRQRAAALQDASRPRQTSVLHSPSSILSFLHSTFCFLLCTATASAATRYVWQDSPSPGPPYTSWTSAAHVIQDAVDVAQTGDTVLVTTGVYATGGRTVGTNLLVNRVAIDRAITVESLMGPEVTIIQGYQLPVATNGDGAVRCVYVADGASLSGFTLTNGATRTQGDNWREQNGGGVWCESTNAFVSNCALKSSSASSDGGGAHSGTLSNCTLSGNSAWSGGGAAGGTLNNCTLIGNSGYEGGGAWGSHNSPCILNYCTLTGNSADSGGGAMSTTLNYCTLAGNSAASGGGARSSTLNHCTLTGNSAEWRGGGAFNSVLNHCTVTGNRARHGGGVGASGWIVWTKLTNCIVCFNTATFGPNYDPSSSYLNFCCTTPLPEDPEHGAGNITLDPQLASTSHLSATSPCRGTGNAAAATGTDIDGEAWANPPSIGCDEYHVGAVTGPLSVNIGAAYTNVATGFPVEFTALIGGRPTASAWEFGDGMTLSNRPYASRAWAAPGDYTVILRAYNESLAGGVSASVTVHVVSPPVHHVNASGTNPLPPYESWDTAATNIQDAVDAVAVGTVPGAWVLVTNGVYAAGGRAVYGTMTNRVAVDKPLALRSVNGPEFTIIQGYQVPGTTNGDGAIRCVYLADGASLSGFTLTNGATWKNWATLNDSGGGVWCESTTAIISNCVLTGNSAYDIGGGVYGGTLHHCILMGNSAVAGGGAVGGALNHCTLTGNVAEHGGGVDSGMLENCTLSGNSASSGGGAYLSTLNHCTLSGNSADEEGGGAYEGTLNNCVLTGNSAQYGGGTFWVTLNQCMLTGNSPGGAAYGALNNCIVYFNTGGNYDGFFNHLNNCCTTPMPTEGLGNITNAPMFVDYAGGNLRLQSNSPCINAGNNAYVTNPTDLDGNPRIVSGTVDIGAYEYQGPGSVISYAWLQQFSLSTDGSADAIDSDADGHTTWQEWRCQTDPTNALSALRLLSATPSGTNVTVTWQSVPGVSYFLERSGNLTLPFTPLVPNLPGQPGTTSFTDTNAAKLAPLFYRVGVE